MPFENLVFRRQSRGGQIPYIWTFIDYPLHYTVDGKYFWSDLARHGMPKYGMARGTMTWHGMARPCCCVQGGPVPCHAMSWFHVPCHIFGVMGLFFGPLGKQFWSHGSLFWTTRPIFNDFLKTKKMRNVHTIILAAVSSHIEPYGPISDQITPEILSIYGR